MSGSGSLEALVERLLARVHELESVVVGQKGVIAEQADRILELQRRLGGDSSTSSRPPSSDAPWDKQPAKKRSSRGRSGRKPGKQRGSVSASRSVVDDPDETWEVAPDHCARCERSLDDAAETARVRRQVVDVQPLNHRWGLGFGLDRCELPERPVWPRGVEMMEVDPQDLA